MTMDVLMAAADELPRLRAQRLLDAASASVAQFQKQEWWDALERRAYADADDDAGDGGELTPQPRSAFRFNGRAVSAEQIKGELAGALGAGFQAA